MYACVYNSTEPTFHKLIREKITPRSFIFTKYSSTITQVLTNDPLSLVQRFDYSEVQDVCISFLFVGIENIKEIQDLPEGESCDLQFNGSYKVVTLYKSTRNLKKTTIYEASQGLLTVVW